MNSDSNLEEILPVILERHHLVNDDTPSVDIFDFDYFESRMKQLNKAFPEDFFVHALAMKANSTRGVVKSALRMGYMGAECASIGEVCHAIACGFPSNKVVYDSPVKSKVYT